MPKHGMARPFTPRTSRLVACSEMWYHFVFDRAINTTGLSPAGSQNCRLLHLGGTLSHKPISQQQTRPHGTDPNGYRSCCGQAGGIPGKKTRKLTLNCEGQVSHGRGLGPLLIVWLDKRNDLVDA
jgi:hypothetical protein